MTDTPNLDRLIDTLRPINPNRLVLGVRAGALLGDLLVVRERASQQWREAVREAMNKPATLIVSPADYSSLGDRLRERD